MSKMFEVVFETYLMRKTYIWTTFIISAILFSCGSAWARQEISLNGQWEMQYSRSGDEVPDGQWEKIAVPSHVSQQEERYAWYRCNFTVPETMAGQRIFLKFGGVKFVSRIYVNGVIVGDHYGGWEPFEVEITENCQIGQENQLLVRATDVSGVIESGVRLVEEAKDSVMAPIGSQPDRFGIWQDVSLEARSDVYIDDLFIKTSVRNQSLEIDFKLRNLSSRVRTVSLESQVYDGEDAQLEMSKPSIVLHPLAIADVTLKVSWPSPELWSPESPHLYSLVSRLTENGEQMDEISNRFGFREFWIDGIYFILNGTRIKFLATAGHPNYGATKEDAKKLYSDIRGANCMAMRLHANLWPESWYEAADEVGMLLIQESALWCFGNEYALSSYKFWENMKDHLSGMIRRDKNHPSVVMYSIENEILHVGGSRVPETERRLADLGGYVKSIDPTRPIMYDGDADPMGVADVENLHYPHEFHEWNLWPDTAYWVDEKTYVSGWPYKEWQWERRKPLYMGEFMHAFYQTPDSYTIFLGDDAYRDYRASRAESKAAAWAMQVEGFRAAEVSGMCPWTLLESGKFPNVQYDAVKRTYEPNAAFVREYDSRFYGGEVVSRTIQLYNDTLHSADLTLIWELRSDGVSWDVNSDGAIDFLDIIMAAVHFGQQMTASTHPNPDVDGDGSVSILDLFTIGRHFGERYGIGTMDSGRQEFKLGPAERVDTEIILHIPQVSVRTLLYLSLQVENNGKSAFRDEKRYWAFPVQRLDIPAEARIAVYTGEKDPIGLEYTDLASLSEIPSGTQLVIIGSHALDSMKSEEDIPVVGDESAPGVKLTEFVRNGGTVFVMQQSVYPEGLLPARLSDHSSTIAFRRAYDSEMLKGISDYDLRMWRGDHIVSEKDISKPTGGCFKAIIDSGGGDGLLYLPLAEVLSGKGRYILCQLSLTRPQAEPAADILFNNIVNYALRPPAERVRAGMVQHELGIKSDVESVGAICNDLTGRLGAEPLEDYGVIIMEAGAPEVSANAGKIRNFVQTGGKVLLHGLTPDDLMNLGGLFPENITLSSSNSVPVTIFQNDPSISGLTNQDLYWLGEHVGPWHSQTPLSLEVMDYVLARALPELEKCQIIEAEDMEVEYGSPHVLGDRVNMYSEAAIYAEITFPESGEYTFGVRASGTAYAGTYPQVALLIDGVQLASAVLDESDWKIYTMTARMNAGQHKIGLAFTNDAWDPVTKEDRNLFLDTLIYAESQPTWVKHILAPGALARVPLGEGFYLIDEINWHGRAASMDKAARYLTNLLVNLGVPFAERAGFLTIPGAEMKPAEDLRLYNLSDSAIQLYGNGHIYLDVRFASSREYRFQVNAKGTSAAGEYPNVRLEIDGKIVGDRMLQQSGWETLTFKAFVDAGVHRVSLAFTNDYWDPPEDRNLDIGWLKIE